jgi:hypothetical protein
VARNIYYEVPHYAVISSLVLLHTSQVHTFGSVPCSQTPSVYAGFEVLPAVVMKKYYLLGYNAV